MDILRPSRRSQVNQLDRCLIGARCDFESLSRRFSLLCVVLSALARKAGGCGNGGLRRVRTAVLRKRSDGSAPPDPPARRAVVGNRYPAGTGASPGGRPVTRVRRALCGRSLARAGCGADIPSGCLGFASTARRPARPRSAAVTAWCSATPREGRRRRPAPGYEPVYRVLVARVAELDDDVVERRGSVSSICSAS
jgi:hypothetical protein